MAYISENRQNFDFFEKGPFKALLNQRKIFSKRLLKMDSFPKKKFYLKKMSVHPLGRILSYTRTLCIHFQTPQIYLGGQKLTGGEEIKGKS